MHRRDIEQNTKVEVQTTIGLYNIHKHNNEETITLCKNISIQTYI